MIGAKSKQAARREQDTVQETAIRVVIEFSSIYAGGRLPLIDAWHPPVPAAESSVWETRCQAKAVCRQDGASGRKLPPDRSRIRQEVARTLHRQGLPSPALNRVIQQAQANPLNPFRLHPSAFILVFLPTRTKPGEDIAHVEGIYQGVAIHVGGVAIGIAGADVAAETG